MLRRSVRVLTGFNALAFAQFTQDLMPAFAGVDPTERTATIMRRFDTLGAAEVAALEERALAAAATAPRMASKTASEKTSSVRTSPAKTEAAEKLRALSTEHKEARAAARMAAKEKKSAMRAVKKLAKQTRLEAVKEEMRALKEIRIAKRKERRFKLTMESLAQKQKARAKKVKAKAREQRLLEATMASTFELDSQLVPLNRENALLDAKAKLLKAVAAHGSPLSEASIDAVFTALRRTKGQRIRFALTDESKAQRLSQSPFSLFLKSCKGREDLAGKNVREWSKLVAQEFKERRAAGTLPQEVVDALKK